MKRSVLLVILAAFTILCLGVLAVHGQEERGNRAQGRPQQPGANMARTFMRLIDLNKDGSISLEEHSRFFLDVDKDKNGYLSQKEIMEFMQNRRQQESGGPDVGQEAPDFALRTLEGDREIKLSDFRGKKPVVLVFGSYT